MSNKRFVKIAEIEKCIECPHYYLHRCYRLEHGVDEHFIENERIIQDWCPLPSYPAIILGGW